MRRSLAQGVAPVVGAGESGDRAAEAIEVGTMHECEPRNFLRPCLLLLLLEGPSHGYDLIRRLDPYDVTDGDPGHVYRALRSLEKDRMVRSAWVPSSTGPSRRVYRLTARGQESLRTTVPALEHSAAVINRFLHTYAHQCAHAGAGSAGRLSRQSAR
jgi:poly-beta-hydroxybutyrate-responsive repressor